jgi:hypothetical protein
MFSNSGSYARRTGALVALCGLGLMVTAIAAAPASAAGPTVVLESGTNGCNGVVSTPGSENTSKTLVGGSMQPGGTAVFSIAYPVDAADVGQTFTITDCVFIGGDAAQKYSISFVPNNTAFTFEYSLLIPEGTALGAEYCNYAKTTAGPSASQASNRKANPACFNVGGSLRIEKRAGSATGALLPGAEFTVDCDPGEATNPPVVVDGLDENGIATTGVIGINGPEGTSCDVTEVAAPDGYDLADDATRTLTIPRGSDATVNVFVNTETVEGCPEGQVDDGDGGCVTPTEEPSIEPSEEPSEEPTETPMEPGDPTPTISPTVLGVKIVKPAQLPTTGSPTGLLVALGLALTVVGGGVVLGSAKHQRQH